MSLADLIGRQLRDAPAQINPMYGTYFIVRSLQQKGEWDLYAMMLAQNDLARAAEAGPIEAKRVARAGRFLAASHGLQRRRFRVRRCPRLKRLHVSKRSGATDSVHLAGQALAEANPYVPLPVRVLNRVEGLKAKGQWDIYNQLLMRRRIHLASQDWDAQRKHLFRVEQRLMDAPAIPSRTVVMDI